MFRILCLCTLTLPLSACSNQKSESERVELATTAIEKKTGNPSVTISDSFFGENRGGAPALCGTATGMGGGSSKFVVVFAKDGEMADIGPDTVTWPIFCDDAAKLRYQENH